MIHKMATLLVVLLLSFALQVSANSGASIVTGSADVLGAHSVQLSSKLTITSGGSGQAGIWYVLSDSTGNSTKHWGGINFNLEGISGTFQNSRLISNLTESTTYDWAAAVIEDSTNEVIAIGSAKQFTTLAVPGIEINAGLNDA